MATKTFKLKYVRKDDRTGPNPEDPKWKQHVTEICEYFSKHVSILWDHFPSASDIMLSAGLDLGDPNDYAKIETREKFQMPDCELWQDIFSINTETLAITEPTDAEEETHYAKYPND